MIYIDDEHEITLKTLKDKKSKNLLLLENLYYCALDSLVCLDTALHSFTHYLGLDFELMYMRAWQVFRKQGKKRLFRDQLFIPDMSVFLKQFKTYYSSQMEITPCNTIFNYERHIYQQLVQNAPVLYISESQGKGGVGNKKIYIIPHSIVIVGIDYSGKQIYYIDMRYLTKGILGILKLKDLVHPGSFCITRSLNNRRAKVLPFQKIIKALIHSINKPEILHCHRSNTFDTLEFFASELASSSSLLNEFSNYRNPNEDKLFIFLTLASNNRRRLKYLFRFLDIMNPKMGLKYFESGMENIYKQWEAVLLSLVDAFFSDFPEENIKNSLKLFGSIADFERNLHQELYGLL